MSNNFFFKFMLSFLLVLGIGLAVGDAWEVGDVVKAVFSDKPASHTKKSAGEPVPLNTTSSALTVPKNSGVAGGAGLEGLPTQAIRPQDSYHKVRWAPPPPGFLTADTFNYLIYREDAPVTQNIKTVLDNIHGNLMLDLTPFTLVVKPNKILVMLFNTRDSYHNFTHLPSWSGASSDLQSDSMYVIEGNSFFPLSVHELTHLYFDGYFLPTISPLWISEGIAVYMQIYESKQRPQWIDDSLRRILAGDIIPLEEMTATEDLNSYDTAKAELWYTQAYSLVDYLLNHRSRDEFYKLCTELKNKTPLHQALYRTYGMPFNKVSVLQNVWLHDLQKAYQEGRILQAPPPSAMTQLPPADGITPAGKPSTKSGANVSKPAPKQAPKPAPKPQPQKTKINKLQTVPVPSYSGGF
ncbi:hypothetical protein [Candidatus Avelusimicrobium luingense]|uniref:hypothetical protein n=1 Tax=Candidatus Avelusimicrobium luingense TaxID=3416211 RepID=UPI003D1302C4